MQLSHLLPILTGLSSLVSAATPTCTYQKAQPTPAGYTCEVQGSVKKPVVLFTISPIPTLQNCWQRCLNEVNCLSYSYGTSSKVCTLYTKTLAAQTFTKGTTGVVFGARNCYVCKCATGLYRCDSSSTCYNLQTDSSNCGKCGNVCPVGRACRKGKCGCADQSGFWWQVNAPGTPYNKAVIEQIPSSQALGPDFDLSGALTFGFQPDGNVSVVVRNVTNSVVVNDYAMPGTDPDGHNIDGTPFQDTATFAAPNNQTVDGLTNVTCRATASNQLACSTFNNTLNKFNICHSNQQGQNQIPYLFMSDIYLNTTDYYCYPTQIDLICPNTVSNSPTKKNLLD